jgi:mono/diheme cytochrome c family protein
MPVPRKARLRAAHLAVALIGVAPGAAIAADEAALELGKAVFTAEAEPSCAICHTLADAGASGTIGPDLDTLKPTEERVRAAVTGGVDVMPAYADKLTAAQIDAVSAYVAAVAGGG